MLTRRALLKGAALSAGALIPLDDSPFDIVAQTVSSATVRVIFLPRASARARSNAGLKFRRHTTLDDGALVRTEWPYQPIGRAPRARVAGLEVEITRDFAVEDGIARGVREQL